MTLAKCTRDFVSVLCWEINLFLELDWLIYDLVRHCESDYEVINGIRSRLKKKWTRLIGKYDFGLTFFEGKVARFFKEDKQSDNFYRGIINYPDFVMCTKLNSVNIVVTYCVL